MTIDCDQVYKDNLILKSSTTNRIKYENLVRSEFQKYNLINKFANLVK